MDNKDLIQAVMQYYLDAISADFDAIQKGHPLKESPYIFDAIEDYLNSGLDIEPKQEQALINLQNSLKKD